MICKYYGRRKIFECLGLARVLEYDDIKPLISNQLDLSKLIKIQSSQFDLISHFIIDAKALINDSAEYLIENLESIRYVSSARIIVVIEEKNNEYINELIKHDINNIIYVNSSDTKQDIAMEFKKAFSPGGIIDYKKEYEKSKLESKDIYEKVKQKNITKEKEEENENSPKITIEKLKPKTNRKIKIAFAGMISNTGTTTLCFNLCSFFVKRGVKASYAEYNQNKDLHYIQKFYNAVYEEPYFIVGDIDCYVNDFMRKEYDVSIIDYGVLNAENQEHFFDADIKFLVTSFSPKNIVLYNNQKKFWKNEAFNVLSYKNDEVLENSVKEFFKDEAIHFMKRGNSIFDYTTNEKMWYNLTNTYFTKEHT